MLYGGPTLLSAIGFLPAKAGITAGIDNEVAICDVPASPHLSGLWAFRFDCGILNLGEPPVFPSELGGLGFELPPPCGPHSVKNSEV